MKEVVVSVHVSASHVDMFADSSGLSGFAGGGEDSWRPWRRLNEETERVNRIKATSVKASSEDCKLFMLSGRDGPTLTG